MLDDWVPAPITCAYHGPLEEAIGWLKGLGKWVLTTVGACAVILLMTFGAVLKFGFEMTGTSQKMQSELVDLRRDVVRLEQADARICTDIDKLKDKHRGGANVSVDRRDD
jgi:hypothetical protein